MNPLPWRTKTCQGSSIVSSPRSISDHFKIRPSTRGLSTLASAVTLSTTRSNGAPQVTMVAYDWDGNDVVISTRSRAAKYTNASRRPAVVFSVPDGADNLTVVGTASCHRTGDDRDAMTARVRDRLQDGEQWAADMLDREMAEGLDALDRVIIQVVPESVTLFQPHG